MRNLAFLLALAMPLSGCFSVIPGYNCLGVPITQEDRDDASLPQIFFWRAAPDPPHEWFNPGALAVNLVTSVALDTVALVFVLGVAALLSAGDADSDDCHHEEHHRKHERHERPDPRIACRGERSDR